MGFYLLVQCEILRIGTAGAASVICESSKILWKGLENSI